MRLILVRHPRPQAAPGLCYGRTDLPAEPAELDRLASILEHALPADSPLFASPLQRCASLAERLPKRPCTLDARLAELDFGKWEMQAWDKIARAKIDAWAQDPVNYRPGGGESVLQMALRVNAFAAELSERELDCAILICHAGTIRLLRALHDGHAPAAAAAIAAGTPHAIEYGACLTLEHCRFGR